MKPEHTLNVKLLMEQALNSVSASMFPEDYAYKLLAWLHHYGDYEGIVFNGELCADLQIARKVLGLTGGATGTAEVIKKLKQYMDQGENAPFMDEIFKKYGIKKRKK